MQNVNSSTFFRAALMALVLATFALAETITLKDGSKISGTITKQTETQVQVKTSYGDLTIDKASIVAIDFGGAAIQGQQTPSVAPQPQIGGLANVDFDRGYRDGKAKGYDDGLQKGKAERKSAQLNGALIGWLTEVLLVALILVASASSY
jgi:hypothetical protein